MLFKKHVLRMFSYGLLIFLGLHLKYSVHVGEGTLRFSCGSSMFVYDGFEQRFHTLPTPAVAAVTDGQWAMWWESVCFSGMMGGRGES